MAAPAEGLPPDALVLGIETSCDETSAAVVRGGRQLLSNVIASQAGLHREFGGVVPEIASRHHLESVLPVIGKALGEAGVSLQDVSGIAVTRGPGLIGALLVGVAAAKGLALARGLPFIGVNHLEGHLYANFLVESDLDFPLASLIVSGGHTDIVVMRAHAEYELLGTTRDDAAGEAFDKAARALGLPYPGGPELERLAEEGDPSTFRLPRAWLEPDSFDFSFSGLKTAVVNLLRQEGAPVGDLHEPHPAASPALRKLRADIAAAFQDAVADVLAVKSVRAACASGSRVLAVAGGVAANRTVRARITREAAAAGLRVTFPPQALCTDNAAMIAAAGHFRLARGERSGYDLVADPGLRLALKHR